MKFFSRKSRCAVSTKQRVAKPRMLPLEDRLAPAGFGPEDGAYLVESWAGYYSDVKIQPGNQYIVAAGSLGSGVAIARYDSVGNIDTAFGSSGKATPALSSLNERGMGLVIQADGKMIVSGDMTGGFNLQHFVARFRTNGSLDGSFGGGGWKSVDVQPMDYLAFQPTTVGLQSTGKVVIAGDSLGTAPGYPENTNPAVLARFTANGALDSGRNGFGTIGQGNKALGYNLANVGGYYDLVVQSDDKIVVLGYSASSGFGGFLVARYTANGALDTSFDGDGYATFLPAGSVAAKAYGITRQSDGKIVVVGSCSEVGDIQGEFWDMFVARFNADGSIDSSFGGGAGFARMDIDGNATATKELGRDLVIQPDGKIVAVGTEALWNEAGDNPRNVLVARFNPDGSPDSTFGGAGFKIGAAPLGTGFFNIANEVALQSNGNIIVAGGMMGSPFLMRFFGTSSPLRAAGGAAVNSSDANPLDMAQVKPLLNEAMGRWQIAGGNVSSLQGIDIRIADLGGSTLGLASGNTIWLDDNAAGWGWFVDRTPRSDSEFITPGNQGEQNRIDLLTVLSHEVGHLLGLDHEDGGVMQETLGVGQRFTPHGVYLGDADSSAERERANGRRISGRLRR